MIAEIAVLLTFLIENCTGVFAVRTYNHENTEERISELEDPLIQRQDFLQDFTDFDPNDHVFQEFDPPEGHETDPKAWKLSLPSWKESFKDCFMSAMFIQTLSGSLIGLVMVGLVILDFTFAEWCFNMTNQWNQMPQKVQSLRVTAQAIEGAIIEMWVFATIASIFPLSLIKDLHLLTLNILAAFIDMTYRLYMQMIGLYGVSWKSFPLNVLFSSVIIVNNFLLARKFYPASLKSTFRLDFILSAQFILGLPAALLLVYGLFPWYIKQDEHVKVIIASISPLLTAIPKVISRLGAQTLHGIIHPGTGFALVAVLYAASAVVFRVMQSGITNLRLFIALGIAHGAIDLVERITVTMRDQIWEYLYRLVRRGRRPQPKHVSLRSRRFVADLTIQIMLHEAAALVGSLGFMTVYQILHMHDKPYIDKLVVVDFFTRVVCGLLIDLVFNTVSLFIQTRLMNIAVRRVWKRKWYYHIVYNTVILSISVIYFSEYLFTVVEDKYGNMHLKNKSCSYPDFL